MRMQVEALARTRGGLVHEHDGGVGHQLHRDRQPLALLHREAALARLADNIAADWVQLHQLQDLQTHAHLSEAMIGFMTISQLLQKLQLTGTTKASQHVGRTAVPPPQRHPHIAPHVLGETQPRREQQRLVHGDARAVDVILQVARQREVSANTTGTSVLQKAGASSGNQT